MGNTVPNPYLTIQEAAKFAELEPTMIRLAIRAGDLEVEKIERRTYIRYQDIRLFVDQLVTG